MYIHLSHLAKRLYIRDCHTPAIIHKLLFGDGEGEVVEDDWGDEESNEENGGDEESNEEDGGDEESDIGEESDQVD